MLKKWISITFLLVSTVLWGYCTNKDDCKDRCAELERTQLWLQEKVKANEEKAKKFDDEQIKNTKKINELKEKARSRVKSTNTLETLEAQLLDIVKDPLQAAILENNILFAIQNRPMVWIKFNNYNPLDENRLVVDPLKALLVLKEIGASTALLTNGQTTSLNVLQAHLGEAEGNVVAAMLLR